MKNKRSFELRHYATRALLLSLLVASSAVAVAQPGQGGQPLNDITLVYRDWAGHTQGTNRTWFYLDEYGEVLEDGGGVYPAVEFDLLDENREGWPVVPGVAYTRLTSSASVTIKFQNTNEFAVTGEFEVIAVRLKVPTDNGGWEYTTLTCNTASVNVSMAANGGIQQLSFTVSDLPDYVALGAFQIDYDLDLTDGQSQYDNGTNGYIGWEWLYFTDKGPHEYGKQAVPWTDLLNYSCRWAYGAEDEDDTRQKVTYGMHYSYRSPDHTLEYDPGEYSAYLVKSGDNYYLDLYQFCDDMDNSMDSIEMQCQDFGGILMIAMESLGYEASAYRIEAEYYTYFGTNKLCPAGTDSTDTENYEEEVFRYHVTARRIYINNYDSSSSYLEDLLGVTHKKPVADWVLPNYWQRQGITTIYGLTYGYLGQDDEVHEAMIVYKQTDISPVRIDREIQ